MKLLLIRDVSKKECEWLKKKVKAGTEVFRYYGATYGCISPDGIACTYKENELPFFELPVDALIQKEEVK